MTPEPYHHPELLPLIPDVVLKKHQVREKADTRFRACARLLQAIWREEQELPIGSFKPPRAAKRRIGSLLGTKAAEEGRNFLLPQVAQLARREVLYQEHGALIDRGRLFGNLLSSMPLAFNLFAPLRLNGGLATKVLRNLLPELDCRNVTKILFEHSPGRLHHALTADRTAFDVAIVYERHDGRHGFLGFEVKYSESLHEGPAQGLRQPYDDLADASGLYKDHASALLRLNPLQQLFREHLLAQAGLIRGDWAEANFILVAPRHNHHVQRAAALYSAYLTEPVKGQVCFTTITLEHFIAAISSAGQPEYAFALHDRYTDWTKVDAALEQALARSAQSWTLSTIPAARPNALLALEPR
ncbi:hypothetical protein ABVV53_08670 [Novosphingobium sp. RD2P27]|uniref:PD-(D/E)XK nuclease-like domain-containing protein n=1 Tax=Novosphingobium kalidii TaxID=3230299 RepID=A0ABV2D0X6_9SPHN